MIKQFLSNRWFFGLLVSTACGLLGLGYFFWQGEVRPRRHLPLPADWLFFGEITNSAGKEGLFGEKSVWPGLLEPIAAQAPPPAGAPPEYFRSWHQVSAQRWAPLLLWRPAGGRSALQDVQSANPQWRWEAGRFAGTARFVSDSGWVMAYRKGWLLLSPVQSLLEDALRASLIPIPEGKCVLQLRNLPGAVSSPLLDALRQADAKLVWDTVATVRWADPPPGFGEALPSVPDFLEEWAPARRPAGKAGAVIEPFYRGSPLAASYRGAGNTEDQYLCFWLRDPAACAAALSAYADGQGILEQYPYQGFEVVRMLDDEFGETTGMGRHPYFTFLADRLIFANSRTGIERWIDYELAGGMGSIPCRSGRFWGFAGPEARLWRYLPEMPGLLWVLRSDQERGTLAICRDRPAPQAQLSWTFRAERPVRGAPFRWREAGLWIVQDAGRRLYALTDRGEVAWQCDLDGPVLSRFFVSAAGGPTLTFNTPGQLWQFDPGGSYRVAALGAAASGGMVVLDPWKKHYLYPAATGRLQGVDGQGVPLAAWNPGPDVRPAPGGLIHVETATRDHVLTFDAQGNLRLWDQHGVLQAGPIPIGAGRWKVFEDQVYIGDAQACFRLDPDAARLQRLAGAQAVEDWQPASGQYYALTASGVTAYRDGRKVWHYPLEEGKALFPTEDAGVGVLTGADYLYRLRPDGRPYPGFPLAGETPFSAVQVGDGQLIVTTLEGRVMAYLLQEF